MCHCFRCFIYNISNYSFSSLEKVTVGRWWNTSMCVSKAYTLSTGSRGLPQMILPLNVISTVPSDRTLLSLPYQSHIRGKDLFPCSTCPFLQLILFSLTKCFNKWSSLTATFLHFPPSL